MINLHQTQLTFLSINSPGKASKMPPVELSLPKKVPASSLGLQNSEVISFFGFARNKMGDW